MDFAFLLVGLIVGFVFGCLFTEWLRAPSEMNR